MTDAAAIAAGLSEEDRAPAGRTPQDLNPMLASRAGTSVDITDEALRQFTAQGRPRLDKSNAGIVRAGLAIRSADDPADGSVFTLELTPLGRAVAAALQEQKT